MLLLLPYNPLSTAQFFIKFVLWWWQEKSLEAGPVVSVGLSKGKKVQSGRVWWRLGPESGLAGVGEQRGIDKVSERIKD